MTLDKFTIKAQEAVQQAVNTAQLNGQQVIEPVPERCVGEGEGRNELRLPETRCKRPADRDARGQRDQASTEGAGRTTVSLKG